MNFNRHLPLEGQHAFLGASKYHWVNYSKEKLINSYTQHLAARKGTELHDFACKAINLGVRLPNSKKTLNLYVNDAIGYKMQTEQVLFYSDNCYGTADTISFKKERIKEYEDWRRFGEILRVHDLKTGITPSSVKQLEVYAALFCLEYRYKPGDIDIELRLYQMDEVLVHHPDPEYILFIMDKIEEFDKIIEDMKQDNGLSNNTFGGDLTKILKVLKGG